MFDCIVTLRPAESARLLRELLQKRLPLNGKLLHSLQAHSYSP